MPRRKMTPTEKWIRDRKARMKQKQDMFERELHDIRRKNIPEPAYLHAVGDRVVYGAYDYTEILEVLDDGKFYRCHSCTISRNTNKGDVWSEKQHYETWYNLAFYKENWPDRVEEDMDIRFDYMQRDLIGVMGMMFSQYGIDLDPEYQRGNVWTEEQKVALIDSIFKNIDIGKFTIIKRPWGSNPNRPEHPSGKLYEMLDGKQRLTALHEFYCGRFKYKGMYFYEMHPRDRNHLKHYPISYAEANPMTDEQKYRYFIKLNTTGTPVDKNHLRKVRELWLKEQLKHSK
jgi:hypothetical protein